MEYLVHFVEFMIGTVMQFIQGVVASLHYVGVALLMAIESANVPLPSEMILTYAGYLVYQGKMNIHLAALAGAIGCVLGSVPCYWLGQWGGRPFIRKYGKWILVSEHDLEKAAAWTRKYGDLAFFLCRMLPIVRTFISTPAGVLHARFWPFVILTFLGSLIWSYFLVWIGMVFGENIEAFKHLWHKFDAAIALLVVVLGIWYVWKHVKHFRNGDKISNEMAAMESGAKVQTIETT
jgi:membrane protein DedA with SNARE-associated domain